MFRKGTILIWGHIPSSSTSQSEPAGAVNQGGEMKKRRVQEPSDQIQDPKKPLECGAEGDSPKELTDANVDKEAATSDHLSSAKLNCETGLKRDEDKDVTHSECQILKSAVSPVCVQSPSAQKRVEVKGQSVQIQKKPRKTILTLHEDIIGEKFWKEHPNILYE